MRPVSGCKDCAGKFGGICPDAIDILFPDNRHPFGGQVHARLLHLAETAQRGFDGGDAGAAINAGHAEIGLAQPLPQIAACQHQLL
ncbi:hypothetical protein D3C71_1912240 [compost metagenome]